MKVKLKDVANISAGQGAPQGDSSYSENGIPFVKAGDLLDLLKGKPIINIQKVTEDIARKYKLKLYSKGTVLFAKSGMSCLKGYVYTLPSNAYVVSHLACITPNIDISKFLQYYFNYYKPNQLVKDKSYPSISLTDIGNMMIDLKTPEKRILIVTVLDKVSDLIALRKKQLAKLDELVKARFMEMFGDPVSNILKWDTVMIGDIAFVTKLAGFEYTEYIKYQNHGDVIMIRGLNVKDKKLKLDDIYYIDSRVSNMLKRSQLKENDIVMTYVGVNIGDVALVDGENIYHLAPNVAKISLNSFEKINPLFLVNLLYFNKEQYALSATNTAKQALNMDKIRKIKIMLPPIKLQNEFVDIIKKVENHKATIKQSLEKLETLKRALMQEYFG